MLGLTSALTLGVIAAYCESASVEVWRKGVARHAVFMVSLPDLPNSWLVLQRWRSLSKRQQGGCQKKRREERLRFPTSVKPWARPAKGRRARISVGIGFTMRLTDPHLGQPRAKDQLTLPKRHDS
ncbi:hypothetical protein GW17_00012069 [Ensete ventricosum]|nr:hypothetical protein GW17_00012069 [Ensete ventricosum]